MRRFLILLGLVALSGCMSAAERDAERAAAQTVKAAQEDTACYAAGGNVRRVCRSQRYMCVMPYKDAGTVCSDSSQCEGRCVGDPDEAPTGGQMAGRCEADNDPCGCTIEIIAGVARTLCVD